MSEQNRHNEKAKSIKHTKKRLGFFFTLIILAVLGLFLWKISFFESADEQLAEIEASRTIPDSENAAVYYNKFFTDPNNISILDELWSHSPASYYLPWESDSDPEGSEILRKNHLFIEKFAEISKIQEARFSFDFYDFLNDRISSYLRHITFILSWAGANDLGDGRIDEAVNKFTSQVMISCHLNQQPMRIYKLVATAIEDVGLKNIRDITMCEDITAEQLMFLDTIMSKTQNYIGQDKELEDRINSLHAARVRQNILSDYPILSRIKTWFTNLMSRRQNEKSWQELLLRRISTQRAGRIMIALRLYQKQNSKWPQMLGEIKSSLPKENLTDAMNNSAFVYKLNGDSFVLYSKGPDNTDDNNKKGSDDVIFWSPLTSQIVEKQASDPNEESKE